jgi:hypothetical protein
MMFALTGWLVALFLLVLWAIEKFNWRREIQAIGDAALKQAEAAIKGENARAKPLANDSGRRVPNNTNDT